MLRRLKTFFAKGLSRKHLEKRLAVTEDDVALFVDLREIWTFRWDEITRIETYKLDCLTEDLICLDFINGSRHISYQTDENMHGLFVLTEQMHQHFPSIETGWWSEVTLPPFATNYKILFETAPAP